jgi:subtilisin family serine protease
VKNAQKSASLSGAPRWLRRVLPASVSLFSGILVLCGLIVGSLWLASASAEAQLPTGPTGTVGQVVLQQPVSTPPTNVAPGHERIVVKLATNAYIVSNGEALTELVTGRGHRLDLSLERLRKDSLISGLGLQVLEAQDPSTLESVLAELRSDPGVVWAEKAQPVYASVIPNDPYYAQEWAPTKVGLPAAWDVTTGSGTVTIAVVDTGLDGTIADFAGRIVSPYSVVNASSAWPYWDDTVGHGTAVAGVAASQGNNASGIAGAAWNVKIMPVKISESGTSDDVTLAQGIVYAVDNGAKVINISFGGSQGSTTMASAVNYALSHQVVVVASSGNSGPGSGVSYPAAYSGVISVGATDSSDTVASFSSTGQGLVLSAPGVSILTWNPNAGGSMLAYWSGTSFSSPLVAGVAALMLSANSSLTPAQVTGILEQTALDLGAPGVDQTYGYGRLRAGDAVAAAAGQSTTTTASSSTTTSSSTTSSSTTSSSTSTTSTSSSTTSTTLPSGTTRYEETNPLLVYAGTWLNLSGASYSGGSMKYVSQSGASVTAYFAGTSLTWLAKTGPSYGKARVSLDGGIAVLVDLYSASSLNQQQVWSTGPLPNGPHSVKIQWSSLKNPAATFTYLGVDAFDVTGTLASGSGSTTTTLSPVTTTTTSSTTTTTLPVSTTTTTASSSTTTSSSTTSSSTTSSSTTSTSSSTTSTTLPSDATRYEETNPLLVYAGTWLNLSGASYSGGSMKYVSQSGASVTAYFAGTSLTWLSKTGPSYGKARVSLDGGTAVLVDLYSPSTLYQQQVWSTGPLPNGPHSVKIQWSSLKNPAATFTYLGVDAFDVTGMLRLTGVLGLGGVLP